MPKKPEQTPTCTVSVNPDSDIKDVTLNLPSFDVFPVEDYDTIDDTVLAQIVYDTENAEQIDKNTNQNNSNDTEAVPVQTPCLPLAVHPNSLEHNVQKNTQNTKITNNKYPILPQMYFPNSNVTINYNFGK